MPNWKVDGIRKQIMIRPVVSAPAGAEGRGFLILCTCRDRSHERKMDVAGGSERTRAAARREFGVLDFKTGRAI
jgi:hypothetical protein